MTQLVGALVSVHDALALLTNLDSLPDPPCSSIRLTGKDCRLVPVDGVIFCVDAVQQIGVSSAMRPHTTIRNLLVHPKDKVNTEETAECVYRIPCKKLPRGLYWRNRTEFWSSHERTSERSRTSGRTLIHHTKRQSQSEQNKSAITNHVNTETHVINCP